MATVTKNVSKASILINPNTHVGEQLRAARQSKGFTAQQALEEYNKRVPEGKRLKHIMSFYQREKRPDVGVWEIAVMMSAIGIDNVMIDDLTWK